MWDAFPHSVAHASAAAREAGERQAKESNGYGRHVAIPPPREAAPDIQSRISWVLWIDALGDSFHNPPRQHIEKQHSLRRNPCVDY